MREKGPVVEPRRLRLPRAARLRTRAEFQRVYRGGVRVRGDFILVVAAPPPEAEGGVPGVRVGLSVGRRFDRSAVGRNRAKRLLREAFRLERHAFPALDMILIPQRGGPTWSLAEVRRELARLAAKAGRKVEARAAEAAEAAAAAERTP